MASAVDFPPASTPGFGLEILPSDGRVAECEYPSPWIPNVHSKPPSPDSAPQVADCAYASTAVAAERALETAEPRTRRKASHAKLHKRAGSKSSLKGRKSEHSDRSVVNTPPIIDEHGFSSPPLSSSSTRSRLRNNVLKLAARTSVDTTDVVDLDKTTAENEELSGLGISSRQTKSVWDVEFTKSRHVRNTSNGSFKPSAPFVHPINRADDPSPESPGSNSHANSLSSSYSGASYALPSSRHRATSNVSSIRRPSLRVHTSGSSGHNTSVSQSAENVVFLSRGSRRGTAQSVGTTTPISRSSLDRAFSIKRNDVVDEESRAASIKAARQAFAEREEAKTRKYEQLDRKAAEKEAKRAARREGRQRRQPSISSDPPSEGEKDLRREKSVSPDEHDGAHCTRLPASTKPSSFKPSPSSICTRDPSQSRKKQALHVAFMNKMKIFNPKR